uniref:Uncharacterized protein LOC104243284 n=1 Tax=Nicotiana sylvestris TaxID=4096 RepID=A0A1U7YBY2_NICSY|nr:PREDICTED: uncharacterized protein LOC104243284 [Nicotiana sylvestris]
MIGAWFLCWWLNACTSIFYIRLVQKRKQQYSTETVSKINRRRRDLYKQLSVDKKELLLTHCRSKKLELKNDSTALLEYTKQAAGFELHTEKPLTIVDAPCVAEKAGISSVVGAVVDCHKGKNITDHFSVFEHVRPLVHLVTNII